MLRDHDIVDDLLKDERFLNIACTVCAVESSPQIKQTFLNIQREEQDIHTRLFQFAQQKGWYPSLWGDVSPQAGVAQYQAPAQAGGVAGGVSPVGQWTGQPAYSPAGGYGAGWGVQAVAGQFQRQQSPAAEGAARQYGPY